MLRLFAIGARIVEFLVAAPVRAFRFFISSLVLNPRFGRFRILTGLLAGYVIFGLVLVYPFAFFWGLAGQAWFGKVLAYANERSMGTAIYDVKNRFVGTFDPALDSELDFNNTGRPIELPYYIAYPDHKSLHVRTIPEHYWNCLVFHEDRHIGGLLSPWGIDLSGFMKIPVSTLKRSIDAGAPKLGAGGSTISMQLARIFFKETPSRKEGGLDKLERKFKEWWLAPVIYRSLSGDKNLTPLKHWAANHFPLAQRTGGGALYGVEQTARVVFGKGSHELGAAEQYVLAAAVNQPIILLDSKKNEELNAYRLASWRRVTGQRARICANTLIDDPEKREDVIAALERISASPPDPVTPPEFADMLEKFAPEQARAARASPVRRSNALVPAAKYGARTEIRDRFGFGWRTRLGHVKLTLNVAENFAFRKRVETTLAELQTRHKGNINPEFTLDLREARSAGDTGNASVPDIVIAAADRSGAIVRYFESNHTSAYFGSARGRDAGTGRYDPERESRFIASVAKMAAAIAIANEATDTPATRYLDVSAPVAGLEACRTGQERRLRRADVAFACSLNAPIEWRMKQIEARKLRRIVDGFSLTMPRDGPTLARSLTVGQVAASPRTVQRMAAAILASLTDSTEKGSSIPAPTLVKTFQHSLVPAKRARETATVFGQPGPYRNDHSPIRPEGKALLKQLLSAPLCYPHGTLRRVSDWCADRHPGVKLHFAKTGTRGTGALAPDADDTVDLWVAGGLQFETGAAFSYVILVGTGNPGRPWARDLYAGSATEKLLRALLDDLAILATKEKQSFAATSAKTTDSGAAKR